MLSEPAQFALGFEHRAAISKDDFFVASPNREAVEWIDRWPNWSGSALAVYGSDGCGKTHLGAVFKERAGARPIPKSLKVPPNEMSGAWIADNARKVICRLGEEQMLHIYNSIVESRGSILFIDRDPPVNWDIKLADLSSRIKSMASVGILSPDDDLLGMVLRKLLSDRQLRVSAIVINFLLLRMERSFLAADKLVKNLDRLALAERREITIPLARRVLNSKD